jgi:hypothetical protein
MNNTEDYEAEDFNMKLYETKQRILTLSLFNVIKKRLDNYKCIDIPSRQQDELMDRLLALKEIYINR